MLRSMASYWSNHLLLMLVLQMIRTIAFLMKVLMSLKRALKKSLKRAFGNFTMPELRRCLRMRAT